MIISNPLAIAIQALQEIRDFRKENSNSSQNLQECVKIADEAIAKIREISLEITDD